MREGHRNGPWQKPRLCPGADDPLGGGWHRAQRGPQALGGDGGGAGVRQIGEGVSLSYLSPLGSQMHDDQAQATK